MSERGPTVVRALLVLGLALVACDDVPGADFDEPVVQRAALGSLVDSKCQ